MDFLKNNRITITAIILFAIALWVYTSFFKGGVPTIGDASADSVGADVIALNTSIQSVTLDQSLFNTSLYRRLMDFSTPVPNQPLGRTNPFATIGND